MEAKLESKDTVPVYILEGEGRRVFPLSEKIHLSLLSNSTPSFLLEKRVCYPSNPGNIWKERWNAITILVCYLFLDFSFEKVYLPCSIQTRKG